jgi:DNA-binding IclR family transcriptional regulator
MGESVGPADGPDKVDRADRSEDRLGVVDRVASILAALEAGPATLASLMGSTGLPRATAHRLAVALGRHGLVGRDDEGRFVPGVALIGLGHAAAEALPLRTLARPLLELLRDETGESVQLFVAEDGWRRCVLSLPSPHALRWIVAEGSLLPLDRGSAGRLLLSGARDGWVESMEEREPGVASVSAPVLGPDGRVAAAVSVSGPIERLSRAPGARFGAATTAAGQAITEALRRSN